MTIISARCDDCGTEVKGDSICRSYGEGEFCERCFLIRKLDDLKSEIEREEEWVESCWLKKIRKMKEKAEELQMNIERLPARDE